MNESAAVIESRPAVVRDSLRNFFPVVEELREPDVRERMLRELQQHRQRTRGDVRAHARAGRFEGTARVSNATRLMSIRCQGETLSEVTLPPQDPHPKVIEGGRAVLGDALLAVRSPSAGTYGATGRTHNGDHRAVTLDGAL